MKLAVLKEMPAESMLRRIVERKIEDLAARAERRPIEDQRELALASRRTDRTHQNHRTDPIDPANPPAHVFGRALRSPDAVKRGGATAPLPRLIAELKERSPSRGPIREDLDAIEVAVLYARHAAAISVVGDAPFFGGSLERLAEVRKRVTTPLLLKDFILSEYQIYEGRAHGADAVLLMASILEPRALIELLELTESLGMDAIVEVHDEAELRTSLETRASIIGINNRDLHSLSIDRSTVHRLAHLIPEDRTVVAESGVETSIDVEGLRGIADAVLVGTSLMSAPDIEAKIIELGW